MHSAALPNTRHSASPHLALPWSQVKLQQQRADPARYYLSIIDSLKAMTGPAAIFDSQHVYGAGQPSMDMDSVGCTAC